MSLNFIVIIGIIYLASMFACHLFYVGLKSKFSSRGQNYVLFVDLIKRVEFIPVVNSLYAIVMIVSGIAGFISTLFTGKTPVEPKDIHFDVPKQEHIIKPFPGEKQAYPALTESEQKIISIVESIDPDRWIPNLSHYYTVIGDTRIILQQMFQAMPPSYPVFLRIDDNFEMRHDALEILYRNIDDHFIKKAAAKKVEDIGNRDQIMADIINKIQTI
jgi:hypothetical protein